MTENEAMKNLETLERFYRIAKSGSALHEVLINFVTLEDLVVAIQALEEIQQYRAIGTVEQLEWCKDASHWKELFKDKLEQYEAIGTVEEIKALKDYKELYDVYRNIGSINEFRNLKNKKNVLPIATIKISKEDMQKIVDEKIKEIELDIQKIRANTIDEFAERLKEKYGCLGYIDEIKFEEVDKIAEQMKAGGKNES